MIAYFALIFTGQYDIVGCTLTTTYTNTICESIPHILHIMNNNCDYLGSMMLVYSSPDWPHFLLSLRLCNTAHVSTEILQMTWVEQFAMSRVSPLQHWWAVILPPSPVSPDIQCKLQ